MIAEIHESKFEKVKYHRAHRVIWVFAMVERAPMRRVIFIPVYSRNKARLESLSKKYVHPGSVIYSDCLKVYNTLNPHFNSHFTVNHSQHFVDSITGAHTNTIVGTWAEVKAQTTIVNRTRKHVDCKFYFEAQVKKNLFSVILEYIIKS